MYIVNISSAFHFQYCFTLLFAKVLFIHTHVYLFDYHQNPPLHINIISYLDYEGISRPEDYVCHIPREITQASQFN